MDEAMGRRTVGGLLVTKGGSILVFREESPRHKATSCCTRLGCSSKLFPNKDRKMCRRDNEAAATQRSPVLRKSNRMSPQGINAYGGRTSRNEASTCAATNNRPRRRENAGRDLLARLKERVNASRKRSSSGGSSPSPLSPDASSTGYTSSSQVISRSLHRPASRMRKDGSRTSETVRMHRDSARVDFDTSSADHDPSGRFLSRRLFRHRRRLQGGPISSLEDNLDGSDGHWRFNMNGSEEELLALGERIGTVSTGLSDGALSECLIRSHYVPTTSTSHEDGDIKCIICQEEYFSGVELAKMVCKHYYHTTCIQQWLRQKNWCPICKSLASTVSSQCS
ncbi:hypothetical protein EJB05_08471 [Eragrostis curvula]|uniref:RING-type E3 ubiquitin transferase n=1 Tax=Eragrostis curvula TaxID=38414 RepID=A0A5J9W3K3_9POAL|nr:hypothetical protein EJB05_08471 [Eragrostis curvula]